MENATPRTMFTRENDSPTTKAALASGYLMSGPWGPAGADGTNPNSVTAVRMVKIGISIPPPTPSQNALLLGH